MCGIAGFIGTGTIADLRSLTHRLQHRGPDAEGLWHEQTVFLGHRRLAIVDLSGGQQPMLTSDKDLVIVFNGEIYNHIALRQQLQCKGHVFVTDHSDTEVLLHGYREWGTELPNKLNGMWSFVLYDRKQQVIFCSRDRFGEKPFFYTCQKDLFVFASELQAITAHPAVTPTLFPLALQKYFAYGYIPAPHTLYKNIYKLPAGHSLIYNLQTQHCNIQKYWDFVLEPFTTIPSNPDIVWAEQLRELLDNAVKIRLMADVPLGIFLSGGVDSSAVAAFARRHVDRDKLNTFSIGFTEADFDESKYAQQVASYLGTQHHLDVLSLDKAQTLLPSIIDKLDEPMGDSSLLPTYLLCRFARQTVTVALGGDGSDELFAGYDPFRALRWATLYQKFIPKPLHQGIRLLFARLPVSHRNMSVDFKIKRTLRGLSYPPSLWSPVWMATLDPQELNDLFQEPIDLENLYSEAIIQWDACQQDNLVDKTLQFYTKLYLQDDILVKLDRASMMVSLEGRCPFLDIDLVNFIRQIPSDYKFRHGQTKYLLKKALEGILPNEILYRSKKGFGVPIGKWLAQGKLTIPTTFPLLHSPFIQEKIHEHRCNTVDNRAFLWNLSLLSRWSESKSF
ncbi:asparagine synthase (glutamine-hydrolyzing) [Beggiatoa leptomitoformis]|uniref:asparagine synthase (glutamine-hydrolyzing) n=1 Tax=Beggiatoa leptomitoformis TaxID=288004 RepID=A0A2N9YHG2_9GAMM|nr:asparagine synthase (glutamine-hydrolyzing) [Beggiatoa leptomitoformis]ALG67821.1 asparagine synthase (glutamine-hydrolyzing) [Beggiatoa leptomitoformis]AUI69924.1 asparagine synthase (glutamine-hydrolyzing) [Beggiatoa leptomitoformis]